MELVDPFGAFEFKPRRWQADALPILAQKLYTRPLCRAVMGAGKSVLIAELCRQWDGRVIVTTPTKELVDGLASTISTVCDSVGRYFSDAKEWQSRIIVCCNASLPTLIDRLLMRNKDIDTWGWIADEAHKTECPTIKNVVGESWNPLWRVGVTATPCRSDSDEKISLFNDLVFDYGPWEAIKDGVIVPYRLRHPPHPRRDINEECIDWIRKQSGPGICDAINIDDAGAFADQLEAAGGRPAVVHSGLPGAEIKERIKWAKENDGCLVHVDLLSEGVDMPWLRWLVVRRPTGAPVRFAQYVGRGLRAYDGKEDCPVFDPHDLFGELSIDPEAVLAGAAGDEPKTSEEFSLKIDFLLDEAKSRADSMGEKLNGPPKNILSPAASWVRQVSAEWKALGILPMRLEDGPLRRERISPVQMESVKKYWRFAYDSDIPKLQANALRVAMRVVSSGAGGAKGADWGTASDLIQILAHLKQAGRWPEQSEGADISGQMEMI